MKYFGLSVLVVLFALAGFPLPSVESAAPSKYDIYVKLDFEKGSLAVKEKVTYTNRTVAALSSIVFNVTPAHYRAFKLASATVDGQPVTPKLDDVVLELPLPRQLEVGSASSIELEFALEMPRTGGRFGISQRVMSLGNWYPVVAAYRDGWDRHRYVSFGDPFLTEVADYEVVIETSPNVVIAHTGDLESRDGNRYTIRASKVRDFALTASDRYKTKTATVDGTTITAFYLPEHEPAGSMYLEAASRSFQWLNKKVGAYPYKTLKVAEVASDEGMVGQEYANIVFISSAQADKAGGMGSYLAYLVAHEIAHQWFYGLVGNDQIQDPWLDESLATFLAYQVLEWPQLALTSPAVAAAGSTPVNASLLDFQDEAQYSATAYGKGAVFLQDLLATMKEDSFYGFLRQYVDTYKDKIAPPRAFFTLAQAATPTNLNPFIRKYFSYPEYKADKPPRLEVNWPKDEVWTGKVDIGFETDLVLKEVVVEADGRWLYVSDGAATKIVVDTGRMEDDEYVVTLLVKDKDDRLFQRSRRAKLSNGKAAVAPQPRPVAQDPVVEPAPRSEERSTLKDAAAVLTALPRVELKSPAAELGLPVAAVVGVVVVAGATRLVLRRRRGLARTAAMLWLVGRVQASLLWRQCASVLPSSVRPHPMAKGSLRKVERSIIPGPVGGDPADKASAPVVYADQLDITLRQVPVASGPGKDGRVDDVAQGPRQASAHVEAASGDYGLAELGELERHGAEVAQAGSAPSKTNDAKPSRPTQGFPGEGDPGP